MAWRYTGVDARIEVIVDPCFGGDLESIASLRPVWIVNSEHNKAGIDKAWAVGSSADLCEVNRVPVSNPDDRWGNLVMILGALDDHYSGYDLAVHGLHAEPILSHRLKEEGFVVIEDTQDGFIAKRIPGIRARVTRADGQ